MGRVFTGWLCFFLLLSGSVCAQAQRAVPIGMEVVATGGSWGNDEQDPIASIASDGEHRVWAIFRNQGTRLGYFKDGKWAVITPEGLPSNLQALQIVGLSDGSIACLWREGANANVHLLSRHTAEVDELLASGPSKLEQPKLMALAGGGMIVTGAGREMLCIVRKGEQPQHISLQEDAFLPPKKYDNGSMATSFVQLRAVQDQRGTIWLWSPAMKKREFDWRLRGLWKIDGAKITPQKIADVAPDQPISVVAPWKDNQLAIAVAGVGWYFLNDEKHVLNTFKETIDELKYIERVFTLQDEWFLITTPKPTWYDSKVSTTFRAVINTFSERFYDPRKRTSALSQVNGLKMEPLTWKLDAEPVFGWPDRPVLSAKAGFWTCADDGLAFISAGEKKTVQKMDWRNGLDLRKPMELARQGESHFVVLDRYTGQTRLLPLNTPPSKPAALRAEMLETGSLLLEDARGRVWGRMPGTTFQCWENGSWNAVKVPEALTAMYHFAFLADDHDQGWLISNNEGADKAAAAVCDFNTGEWSVFDNLQAALTARMHPDSRLVLRDHPSLAPVSSAGTPRRIGFLRNTGVLHHFNGTRWSEWKVADIAGPDARVSSALFFDAQQRLTVSISGYRWRLSSEEKWQRDQGETGEEEDAFHTEDNNPPPDCSVKKINSTAYDRHGVCWLSDSEGRLWKCIHGCTVPVLQPDEPSPLAAGVHLYEVRSDLSGNAFLRLEYGAGGGKYLTVRSRLPLPESVATLREVRADTAQFTFGGAAWHVWRVDAGAWSQATDKEECVVTGLLPGVHVLEVMAYNADLTPAKASAKLKVTIEAAAIAELNELIQKLGGDDLDATEAAARRLRSQGRGILPNLNKAREKVEERTRWWLDAVIQQIEAQPPRE